MRKFFAAALMLLPAGAASAQQSQTTCWRDANDVVHCETTQPNPRSYYDDRRSFQELQAARQAETLRRVVGKAISEGRCEDARAAALRGGDLALADQTERLCRPPSAPSAAPMASPAPKPRYPSLAVPSRPWSLDLPKPEPDQRVTEQPPDGVRP